MPELAACVKNLAIIGNLINIGSGINLSMISSYHHEAEFNTMFGNMSKAMQKADSVLAKLAAKGISVVVMPGKNDAADSFMPQRPLARLMFEKTFAAGCDDN